MPASVRVRAAAPLIVALCASVLAAAARAGDVRVSAGGASSAWTSPVHGSVTSLPTLVRHVHPGRRARAQSRRAKRVLWGVQVTDPFARYGTGYRIMDPIPGLGGKAPSIVPFNLPFEGCSESCNYYPFPTQEMDAIHAYGSLAMLNWSSQSSPLETDEPAFTLAKVADGNFDTYIRSFALAAKQWGHPFLLRFDWEMNGHLFPWAVGANGNQVSDFVAAWRHVHDIFTSVGATNATWVWCPEVDNYHQFANLSALYPGNDYVDWTCLDGYNFGNLDGGSNWQTFSQVFSTTYTTIQQIAPTKPMIIGETASTESGGSKAAWITDMFKQIQTNFPNIHALIYYDKYQPTEDGTDDWPLQSSTSALDAFKAGVASRFYTTNTYRGDDLRSKVTPP